MNKVDGCTHTECDVAVFFEFAIFEKLGDVIGDG